MIRARRLLMPLVVSLAVIIAGCSSSPPRKTSSSTSSGSGSYKGGGGYYKDDGPGADIPDGIDETPDPIPRIEPLASGANRPYTVLGKRYVPMTDPNRPYKRTGVASWYGKKFHGNSTSIGESYDMYALTAAHPTMPLPSYARVTSSVNGRTVIVRVNDRGPFHRGRIMDLSYTAAHKLGLIGGGSGKVTVERILPSEIRLAQSQGKIVTASGISDPNANKVAAATEAPAAAGKVSVSPEAPAQTVESIVASSGTPAPSGGNVVAAAGAANSATGIVETSAPASPPTSSLRMREIGPATIASGAEAKSDAPVQTAGSHVGAGSGAATVVASAEDTPLPTAAPAGAVYLQMGAFSQPTNAQALVRRVNSQMGSSTGNASAVVQQNGSLYRVRLGPYADRVTALNAAQQVADRTGILPSLATY